MLDCKNDNCYYALYKKTDDDILDVLIEPQAETVKATLSIIDTYIEDSSEKIDIYQKIALCRSEEDISNVVDEVIDRFGNMPDELNNLLEIARIKQFCRNTPVIKITEKKNRKTGSQNVVFYFEKDKFDPNVISSLIKKYGTDIKFSDAILPYITLFLNRQTEKELIRNIKEFLKMF